MATPYQHDDISVLAKSLKKQLSALDRTAGHVDLLNMLARATGQQNYQSWLATQHPANSRSREPQVEALLRVSLDSIATEVYLERRPDGSVRDRRHEAVSRVYALIDVEIQIIPHVAIIRTLTSLDAILLGQSDHPADWFKYYVLHALIDLADRTPSQLTIFGHVELPIDRYVAEKKRFGIGESRRGECKISLPLSQLNRLKEECDSADQAVKDFDRVKELLWRVFGEQNPLTFVRTNRANVVALTRYLREFLDAEREMFMGDWNREKFGAIIETLDGAVLGRRSVTRNDFVSLRGAIFTASAPHHWDRPVFAPAALFESSPKAA